MKSDVEVLGLIRGGAEVQWDRGAVLHEMPITYPMSRGGPIYQGTVASCVRECMAKAPQPMVMYSMSFDAGVMLASMLVSSCSKRSSSWPSAMTFLAEIKRAIP